MKNILSIFLLVLPILLNSVSIEVPQPKINNNRFDNNLPEIIEPGQPSIPYIPVKILLGMGERLSSVSVVATGEQKQIKVDNIEHANYQIPISSKDLKKALPDPEIYENDDFFPAQDYKVLGVQRMNGYDILLVNIYPYKYNPVKGLIAWNNIYELEYTANFDPDVSAMQQEYLRKDLEIITKISSYVINPQKIVSYHKSYGQTQRELLDPANPYALIIITDELREPYFEEFVSRRNSMNLTTGVFLVEDIYQEYDGVDQADKVRNFIIDAYQIFSGTDTPLEYVLLGGDDEIVPKRGCYGQVGNTVDNGIPCDLYFSCLDGNWNANDNSIYGEWEDEVDMLPEIAIGRIPAESEQEFDHFFYKTFYYEDNYCLSDDIAYMLGENLNWEPLTWGGDYKDEVAPLLDENIHIFTLYDRDGTYSAMAVKDAIDYGVSVLNHMGHSNESMVFGQNIGMTNNYTNTEYGFAYSQGCYPAAFDESTSGIAESIAENLVIKEHGLFAFVGNTRYGWYSPGSTNGASQPYDIAFFDAIYQYDIREMGNALQYSREVLVNQALQSGVMRWVYFELVLFGDPSLQVKQASGGFPLIQPAASFIDDTQGDGDTIVNPGETVDIYITLENLEGWSDAEDVYAIISFNDDTINVSQDSVYYGYIPNGSIGSSGSFVIHIPQDVPYGNYTYQLDVYASVNRNLEFHKTYEQEIEISLYQLHWPWFGAASFISNPMLIDFDNNGSREILIPNSNADFHLLDIYAQEISGFPWISDENIWRSTALGDIDGDESFDLVIASRNGRIFAYGNNGDMLFSYEDCLEQLLTPIIADLDSDSLPEVISFGIDKKLIVLDSSGNLKSGFPIELSFIGSTEMAVADLNEDGNKEIIIGTNDGNLYAIRSNGENLSGFPVNIGSPILAAPVVSPDRKIIIGSANSQMHIIGSEGDIELSLELDSRIAGSAILADFDNDNNLEIAFGTVFGGLYLLEFDGSTLNGFPVMLEAQFSNPPLAADINNDQYIDLLAMTSMNCLFAYHYTGLEFDFSPVPTNLSGNTPVSIDDVDFDGDYEIVCGNTDGVVILDCKLDAGEDLPWRTYRGNYQRTGFYGDNQLLNNQNEIVPAEFTKLYQNYPNPFNPNTRISFQLSEQSSVELSIFNIKGQKVKTLVPKQIFEKGLHEFEWYGKDDNNRSVTSGIYFYKLNSLKKVSVKKMLLLK